MRRGNQRAKAGETLKKKTAAFFTNPDPSTSSRDMKRKRSVTFVDVDHHRNDPLEAQFEPSVDAKTSEFAFFNKLKSTFGLSSSSSEASNKVKHNLRAFEFRDAGTDLQAKDIGNTTTTCSFSTPIYNARRGSPLNLTRKDKGKDPGKCSSGFKRDNGTVRGGNNNNQSCGGGSSDEKEEDFFSVKRKRLNQWVKHTWFSEIPYVTSNRGDLVSLLLTRLFPGTTDERHPSRSPKEKTDRNNRRTFLDSPGSKFIKRSYEVDHSLQMEKNMFRGWLKYSSAPSLQFARNQVLIPRDPQDFSISYPKEWVYRHPLLTQKVSFPVEETLDSSLQLGNYKSPSLGYHGEESGYSSSHDHRKPSSALLLEWNASTRKTNDLQPSNHTEFITCPNASSSSSSLADNPWRSDYSSSHDVVTWELYPLPLPSHYTSGSFLLPATNQTSHFEHEFERHMTDEEDVVAANQNLQTFHHGTSSSDCLTRDYKYYHSPPNSPLDHSPFKVTGREMVSFPFSSISNSDLLEASSPTRSDRWWI